MAHLREASKRHDTPGAVPPLCGEHIYNFPPLQRLLALHPTCILLGFSAALAPKFPPSLASRGCRALLSKFDASHARVEALEEVRRARTCRKREKPRDKKNKNPPHLGFGILAHPRGRSVLDPGERRRAQERPGQARPPGGPPEAPERPK